MHVKKILSSAATFAVLVAAIAEPRAASASVGASGGASSSAAPSSAAPSSAAPSSAAPSSAAPSSGAQSSAAQSSAAQSSAAQSNPSGSSQPPSSGAPSSSSTASSGVPSSTPAPSSETSSSAAPSTSISPSSAVTGSTSDSPLSESNVPTTSTDLTTSTTTEPLPTWSIVLTISSASIDIGDADTSGFEDQWKDVCSANGCAPDSTTDFDFDTTDGFSRTSQTGTFHLEGHVDDNETWRDMIMDQINDAVQKSISCHDESYQSCPCGFDRRDFNTGSRITRGDPCCERHMTICSIVSSIGATVYDENNSTKAEMSLQVTNDETNDFDCNAIFDAADIVPLDNPFAEGTVAFLKFICDEASGRK